MTQLPLYEDATLWMGEIHAPSSFAYEPQGSAAHWCWFRDGQVVAVLEDTTRPEPGVGERRLLRVQAADGTTMTVPARVVRRIDEGDTRCRAT